MHSQRKVLALIPARLDSTRLPGKGLTDLAGRPLLWYLIERLRSVEEIDEIVIATTRRSVDDQLQEFAAACGISCYRGETDDVLTRFVKASRSYNGSIIVRANGDNPLLAPELIRQAIHDCVNDQLDFVTGKTVYTGIPIGLGPEVIRKAALEKLVTLPLTREDREHVTAYIFRNPASFLWKGMQAPSSLEGVDASKFRFTVDTLDDLERMRILVSKLRSMTGVDNPADWMLNDLLAAAR